MERIYYLVVVGLLNQNIKGKAMVSVDYRCLSRQGEQLCILSLDAKKNKELDAVLQDTIKLVAAVQKFTENPTLQLESLHKNMQVLQAQIEASLTKNETVDYSSNVRDINAQIVAIAQAVLFPESEGSKGASAAVSGASSPPRPSSPLTIDPQCCFLADEDPNQPPSPDEKKLLVDVDDDLSADSDSSFSSPPDSPSPVASTGAAAASLPSGFVLDTGPAIGSMNVPPVLSSAQSATGSAAAVALKHDCLLENLQKLGHEISVQIIALSTAIPEYALSSDQLTEALMLWFAFVKQQCSKCMNSFPQSEEQQKAEAALQTATGSAAATGAAAASASAAIPVTNPILDKLKSDLIVLERKLDEYLSLSKQLPSDAYMNAMSIVILPLQRAMANDDDDDDVLFLKELTSEEYAACLIGISNFNFEIIDTFMKNVLCQKMKVLGLPTIALKINKEIEAPDQMFLMDQLKTLVDSGKKIPKAHLEKFLGDLWKQDTVLTKLSKDLFDSFTVYFKEIENRPKGSEYSILGVQSFFEQKVNELMELILKLKNEISDMGKPKLEYIRWTSDELQWTHIDLSFKIVKKEAPKPPEVPINLSEAETQQLAVFRQKHDAAFSKIQSTLKAFCKEAAKMPESVGHMIYLHMAREFLMLAIASLKD